MKAFSMIELIFVIVILGILAAVAIPRLAGTRVDAEITATLANIRTFLSDAGAYYVAKGGFYEGEPLQIGQMDKPNGIYAKYKAFTNVNLYEPQKDGAKIDINKDIWEPVAFGVANKPCIQINIYDALEHANNNLPTTIVAFREIFDDGSVNNSSMCNVVKNSEVIKLFTHNVVLTKDNKPYTLNPRITGAIAFGSSNSVYDLNFTTN